MKNIGKGQTNMAVGLQLQIVDKKNQKTKLREICEKVDHKENNMFPTGKEIDHM